MKTRLAPLLTFGMAFTLATGVCAQVNNPTRPRNTNQNPSAAQNRTAAQNQNQRPSEMQTIRGVVSGVTAEGEMVVDYRTNQAVMSQMAYATIVGSPTSGKGRDSDRGDGDRATNNANNKHRDNVYVVWLSPRTKVYDASDASDSSSQKKESTLDRLEVGDRVEIQFAARNESATGAGTNQPDQMRRKHGRHRTFVGDANSITILASKKESENPERSR